MSIDVTNFGSTTAEFVSTIGYYGAYAPGRPPFNGAALRERYADDPVALAMIDYIEELLAAGAYWTPSTTTIGPVVPGLGTTWGTGTVPVTWSPGMSTSGTTWSSLTTPSGPHPPFKAKRRKRR